MQHGKQPLWAGLQLLARLTLNAGKDTANQPARLAHLDHGNDRAILRAALTLVLMLGIYGPVQAVARNAAASGSLLGPLTAQRTADGMTISGTIRNIPAGTKMWVEIIHEPGGPEKPVSGPEDDHVIVNSDGKFQATILQASILNPSGAAFRSGTYRIMIESHFSSGWQTIEVLRKAGVELDSQGRSDIYTDPKSIPESPDFKPNDTEFPKAGRYLSVTREVNLGSLPADQTAVEAVKSAILLVQGEGLSSLPVGKSVEWFAKAGGFKPVAWSAQLGPDGKWVITLDCIDGEKPTKAQWSYDPKSNTVRYLDHLAKTVSYVPAD
jgi:hypothetical protein